MLASTTSPRHTFAIHFPTDMISVTLFYEHVQPSARRVSSAMSWFEKQFHWTQLVY